MQSRQGPGFVLDRDETTPGCDDCDRYPYFREAILVVVSLCSEFRPRVWLEATAVDECA